MDVDLQENEIRLLSITLHENYAQMDQRLEHETLIPHYKKTGSVLPDTGVGKDFLNKAPFAQESRPKTDN